MKELWMMSVVNLRRQLKGQSYRKIRVQDGETCTRLSERSRELIPETR